MRGGFGPSRVGRQQPVPARGCSAHGARQLLHSLGNPCSRNQECTRAHRRLFRCFAELILFFFLEELFWETYGFAAPSRVCTAVSLSCPCKARSCWLQPPGLCDTLCCHLSPPALWHPWALVAPSGAKHSPPSKGWPGLGGCWWMWNCPWICSPPPNDACAVVCSKPCLIYRAG